jgi:hypothetical protein
LRQNAVCLEHESHGFLQVRSGFIQRSTLRVGARQFLDEPDIAVRNGSEHGRELKLHTPIIALTGYRRPTCMRSRRTGRSHAMVRAMRAGHVLLQD